MELLARLRGSFSSAMSVAMYMYVQTECYEAYRDFFSTFKHAPIEVPHGVALLRAAAALVGPVRLALRPARREPRVRRRAVHHGLEVDQLELRRDGDDA